MRTNYLQRNSSRRSKVKQAVGLVILFAVLFAIFSFGRGVVVTALSPLWKGENFVARAFKGTTSFFKSKDALLKENAALKEELASYESLVVSARAVAAKNDEIMNELGRTPSSGYKLVGILSRPPETPYDVFIVDLGKNGGIRPGAKVKDANGYLLGSVSEVYLNTSRVKLYSLSGAKTDAVLERGMVPVVLEGAGGGNFKLNLPRDMDIQVGDRILAPGVSGEPIAYVGDVSIKPTDSFKEVLASSPSSPFKTSFVYVEP